MLKKALLSLVALILSNSLYAECGISHKIMYGIAKVEHHAKRDVGYPYIISFNNPSELKDIKKLLSGVGLLILDDRSIDCKNQALCINTTQLLINSKITNLDLGAFQVNYESNVAPLNIYFDLSESYSYACNLVTQHIKKNGFTWESIANYHSKTKSLNTKYKNNLLKEILKTYPELAYN